MDTSATVQKKEIGWRSVRWVFVAHSTSCEVALLHKIDGRRTSYFCKEQQPPK